jgi:hypothetical protein
VRGTELLRLRRCCAPTSLRMTGALRACPELVEGPRS